MAGRTTKATSAPAAAPPAAPAEPTPLDAKHLDATDAASSTATPDQIRAAQKRRDATAGATPETSMVDALLAERRGYVQRGLDDRVAQVDEQIRHYGATPPTD